MEQPFLETTIRRYSRKGHGVGAVEQSNGLIEVPGTLLGEKLHVAVQKKRRKRLIGQVQELLLSSPDRVPPLCEHAALCGGCTWQQMAYGAQIKEKESRIRELFFSFGGEEPLLHPMIPCSSLWEYRSKMEYTFSQDREGKQFLGLVLPFSKGKVLNLMQCTIAPPWFAQLVVALRSWWQKSSLLAFHPPSNRGSLRTLTLRQGMRTGKKMVVLTVSGRVDFFITKQDLDTFTHIVEQTIAEGASIFLRIHRAEKGKPSDFYEMHLAGPSHLEEKLLIEKREYFFALSPSSFFQPNPIQAEKLFTRVLEMAALKPEMVLYDLFAGGATLGILAAPFVRRVFSVENNPYAVCDAKVSIEKNQIDNLVPIEQDVLDFLSGEVPLRDPPDLILVDPPRSGLHPKVLSLLAALQVKKILYVSCSPLTQQADCAFLLARGYVLSEIQPVDQFPHTPHVENIALLQWRGV